MEVDRLLTWQVEQLEDEGVDIETIVLLYPTSPLRTIEAISDTIREVTANGYDSALTLYEDTRYLWKKDGDEVKPTNYDPHKRGPTQLEEWNQWVENKAVYAVDREILVKQLCRLGGRISFVEIPMHRSVNIDTAVDYELAKFIAEVDGASW
jgi:N-acylneuraminate cytidylyltransferase